MLKHHRQPKDLDGAIVGEDLPPFHPNCKCTIGSYVDFGNEEPDDGADIVTAFLLSANKSPDYKVNFEAEHGWIYTPSESVFIGDTEIHYSRNLLQNPCIINDMLLMPFNITEQDKNLLQLMWDLKSCSDSQKAEGMIRKGYENLAKTSGEGFSVDFFKPLSYYEVGRDVTKEIDEMMEEYMSTTSPGDILKFYGLVKNNGELDLKNREAYKTNSTYILNGTIVDRDALGNYTYGYFGRYIGIPANTLLAMGGYAQIQANTSSPDFINTFGDDPRDQYMVLEGIKAYEIRK